MKPSKNAQQCNVKADSYYYTLDGLKSVKVDAKKTVDVRVVFNDVSGHNARSAWDRGVQETALDMLEELMDNHVFELEPSSITVKLLNGASDWDQYAYGGCHLIYDEEIAARYGTPAGLKRTRNGKRNPNKYDTGLDVESRACAQAAGLIKHYVIVHCR